MNDHPQLREQTFKLFPFLGSAAPEVQTELFEHGELVELPADQFIVVELLVHVHCIGEPVQVVRSNVVGLNIFAAGYPISSPVACNANEPGAIIEETVLAGGSSLSYDAATDRYTYVWKTDKAWIGSCRIFALRLKDDSDHFAKFRFR